MSSTPTGRNGIMAEQTEQMKTGDNPADFGVDAVEAHLASADQAEVDRVLAAETGEDGKDRVGVKNAAEARAESLRVDPDGTGQEKGDGPKGLAATGNPLDLSTKGESNTTANIGHQEGAPEELIKVADESAAKGFFGENAAKPDYSQSNSEVMNGGENA